MKRTAKMACLVGMILMLVPTNMSAGTKEKKGSRFDWNPGKADAVDKSGKSCGIMQITPILVKECNRILELKNSDKRYTMKDRFSVKKSKEMFLLFQSFYNPKNNVELAIRSWNGGMHYTRRGTQKYFEKVMSKMK